MVHDAADVPEGPACLDAVRIVFDEQRLISDAGLLVTATLADRLGLEELVNESVWLDPRLPGACLPGRKVMSLVHGMLAGADSIDDMNLLRAGSTQLILGHRVMAPSTLGTFLRAFTFGHVRQLDRVLDVALARAWQAGAGPGDGPLVIDLDSFIGEVHSEQKQGASYGYTRQLGYHPILAVRADTGEVLHIRNRKGKANTQRGAARFVDELLARVRRAEHTGPIVIRADSGFENHKLMRALHRPWEHRQHVSPLRCAAARSLPVTHAHPPELPKRRSVWITTEVAQIQPHRLLAAQPPRVDRLEHHRIAERRQRPLAPQRSPPSHPRVEMIEEEHQLLAGQRPPPRIALVLGNVTDRVGLVEDLHRPATELPLTDRRPGITPVD